MAANGFWTRLKSWLAGCFIPIPRKEREKEKDTFWPWGRILVVWSLIAFGVLLAGGVAFRAHAVLRYPPSNEVDFGWVSFWCPLLFLSAGGGLAIGLLILSWWEVTRLGFSWTLGFLFLGIVLFALFVWPTPYTYHKTCDPNSRMRVHRLTGEGAYIPDAPKMPCPGPAQPASAKPSSPSP